MLLFLFACMNVDEPVPFNKGNGQVYEGGTAVDTQTEGDDTAAAPQDSGGEDTSSSEETEDSGEAD